MTSYYPVIVVIPCLNEQTTLLNTCLSLGFGTSFNKEKDDRYLILVDNGSTDDTIVVAEHVRGSSPAGRVFVIAESERGYVPPRHSGNIFAKVLAESYGWADTKVVILQADADTIYNDHYVETMRTASIEQGEGILLQGYSEYRPDFLHDFPNYAEICHFVDKNFEKITTTDINDFIVDDKVCAYRLSDYFQWGGHQREHNIQGEEIHAETTRLYLRAASQNAHMYKVDNAIAYHSVRNLLKNPLLEIASAGFPREQSWMKKWRDTFQTLEGTSIYHLDSDRPETKTAIMLRLQNTIALFLLLPFHVTNTVGRQPDGILASMINKFGFYLPRRKLIELSDNPGKFLEDVFQICDRLDEQIILQIANTIEDYG